MLRGVDPDCATVAVNSVFGKQPEGFRVNAVFDRPDPIGELGWGIVGVDRDRLLKDNGAVIVFLVDKVDGGACPMDAVVEHGAVDVHSIHALAAKGRKESGVNVCHASPVFIDHIRGNLLHVSRKGNERCVMTGQRVEHCPTEWGWGLERGRLDYFGRDVLPVGAAEGACIGDVAYATNDVSWKITRVNRV